MSNKYIKSPLNYVGGKHKLLPQIEPLFPKEIGTFYDLFAGGGNVGINVNANKVIFNDIEFQSTPPVKGATLIEFYKVLATDISIHAPSEGSDNKRI